MAQILNQWYSLFCLAVSFASVCVSLYAVRESRKAILTGNYFSEMTSAYAEYLRCVCDLMNRRGKPERDAIVSSLYRLRLFAPLAVCNAADDLYAQALDWARTGQGDTFAINGKLDQIGLWFARDLDHYRRSGTHARVGKSIRELDPQASPQ